MKKLAVGVVTMVIIGLCVVVYRGWHRERLLEYIAADKEYVLMIWYQNAKIEEFNCNNSDRLRDEIGRIGNLISGAKIAREKAEARLDDWW